MKFKFMMRDRQQTNRIILVMKEINTKGEENQLPVIL